MIAVYALIYTPILLFVIAFLYETYLSFRRLKVATQDPRGYLDATWEITHTVLVFGVVMLLMLYTQDIDRIAQAIFTPAFIALTALGIRAACYIYLFYVRTNTSTRNWVDWLFALSHVVAALFLVAVVVAFTWLLLTTPLHANTQFIPSFMVGLAIILAIVAVPIFVVYRTKR